ncbi:MAG: hypothetical protein GY815_08230 [Gammaproteobacteria bacterium]|nr:hypothetical protein [Gammaproteobacteria bacterium]
MRAFHDRRQKIHVGPCVLVGDAAGFVDAITGESMTLALATAQSCAASVLEILGGKAPEKAFQSYVKNVTTSSETIAY